jgi:hypothetical protein
LDNTNQQCHITAPKKRLAQPELRAFCFEVGRVFGRKGAPQTPQCEAKKDKTVPYIGTPIKKQ